jgi:uncharacterized protein YjiS (DUF1127 family)
MTTLDHSGMLRTAPRQAWAPRAANIVSRFFRTWKNRREFLKLGEMSDAELSDIGLVRGDLHAAVGLPFGIDPTARLNTVVETRAEIAARSVC